MRYLSLLADTASKHLSKFHWVSSRRCEAFPPLCDASVIGYANHQWYVHVKMPTTHGPFLVKVLN